MISAEFHCRNFVKLIKEMDKEGLVVISNNPSSDNLVMALARIYAGVVND